MDYKVYPIAMTQVDWPSFIKICQEYFGSSPTRGIDTCNIPVKSPSAFLACLSLDNDPINQLRHGWRMGGSFEHVSFAFIFVLTKSLIPILAVNTELNMSTYDVKDSDEVITLLSGSMKTWRDEIIKWCSDVSNKHIRKFMNICYVHFKGSGLGEVWCGFDQVILDDTFILKPLR